jgi:hypothetical protein
MEEAMTEEKIAAGLAALMEELAQLRGSLDGLRNDVQEQTKTIAECLNFVGRACAGYLDG